MKLHLDTHSYRAGMKYYNKRSAEIMDLWETVCPQYSYYDIQHVKLNLTKHRSHFFLVLHMQC